MNSLGHGFLVVVVAFDDGAAVTAPPTAVVAALPAAVMAAPGAVVAAAVGAKEGHSHIFV
ncbi:hypothetical protein ANCDUO_06645 [Ancylostoma duodenale]|uniref:Secreted protein n=1 Tax=Ancylostoma duodenale TaxID=51022 RepID=A0A0C2D153_9BILA|nr:hypothetical protein ANCDUO_06645 [Ancylostoma duodenale]